MCTVRRPRQPNDWLTRTRGLLSVFIALGLRRLPELIELFLPGFGLARLCRLGTEARDEALKLCHFLLPAGDQTAPLQLPFLPLALEFAVRRARVRLQTSPYNLRHARAHRVKERLVMRNNQHRGVRT